MHSNRNSVAGPSRGLFFIACVPVLYIALPLATLLFHTQPGTMLSAITNSEQRNALLTSTLTAMGAAVVSLLFGAPLAFLLAQYRTIWARLTEGILLLPILLPALVNGLAGLAWFGPYGVIGEWFNAHGIPLSDSAAGIVLAQTFVACPFLIFSARAGFQSIENDLYDAAANAGASFWQCFYYIALPLARRAILVGSLLTFARAFGEFGATLLMAYTPRTVPVEIWTLFSETGLDGITPLASVLIIAGVLLLAIFSLLSKRKNKLIE